GPLRRARDRAQDPSRPARGPGPDRGHRHLDRGPTRAAGHHPAPARGPALSRPHRSAHAGRLHEVAGGPPRRAQRRSRPVGRGRGPRGARLRPHRPRRPSHEDPASRTGDPGLAGRRAALRPAPSLRRRADGFGGQRLRGARDGDRPHRHGLGRRGGPSRDPGGGGADPGRKRRKLRDLRHAEGGGGSRGRGPGGAPHTGRRRDPGGGVDSLADGGSRPGKGPLSLNGNLEDLPLLDILQIVSFSKKTGYLSIRTEGGEGAIVFQDGYVVAAFSAETPPFDPRYRHLPPEARTKLLRQNIEHGLEQLIRLREGQFSFSLTEGPPRKVGPRDISEETLPQGINAQELLLDLARGMDEDRRDSTAALEASFAEPPDDVTVPPELAAEEEVTFEEEVPVEEEAPAEEEPPPLPVRAPAPAAAPPPPVAAPATETEITTILLVDDEDEVRRILAERFTRGGYNVV